MSQQGPNIIELYEAAVQAFRQTLSGVKSDQMSNSTPCSEWNVQKLVNHNLKVTAFTEGALTGNITVNPMEVDGPLPPEGAQEALDTSVAKILELIKAPGALEKELNTPFGTMPGAQFMVNPFGDLLIHQWDLAKGTSQSTTLDGGLVEACYNFLAPNIDGMRNPEGIVEAGGAHIFSAAVSVSQSASLQDKLLGISGRHP